MNLIFGDSISRNIGLQVFTSLMLVIAAIGSVDFIFSVLSELSDISPTYTFGDVLIYSILKIPYSLYNLSPYLCLIGFLMGIGNLNDLGEITASRVLGKSNLDIIISALKPVVLIMVVGLIASEYWLPNLSQKAEEGRLIKQDVIKIDQGYWLAREDEISYFQSSPSKGLIKNVTIYRLNPKFNLKEVITASQALAVSDYWELEDIKLDRPTSVALPFLGDKNTWRQGPDEDDFSLLLNPRYFSLTLLYKNMHDDVSEYRRNLLALEFWRKISKPIVTLALILLSVSFVFGPMRDQKSGQRILLGIVTAFSVNIIQSLFESISMVSGLSTFFAVLIPIVLILITAIILNLKIRFIS